MKNPPFSFRLRAPLRRVHLALGALFVSVAFFSAPARAVDAVPISIPAGTAVFLAAGQGSANSLESFVIPVSDAARIAEIRQYLTERAAGTETRPLIAHCTVALSSADVLNRNYSAPGTPLWGWRVTELLGVRRARLELELYANVPAIVGRPSDIAGLLRTVPPGGLPDNQINLIYFPIVMELKAEVPRSTLGSISDRGFAGTGAQSKITGFSVEGNVPRSVVIRVLGPSLTAFGVAGALANPRFELYRGSEKIAENDDWTTGNLNRPVIAIFPPPLPFLLIPRDLREPALELSLPPGAYTVVVTGVNGTTGIVLTEIYTLNE